MEDHLRSMSLAALAEQCLREINAIRRGETHDDQCWGEVLRRARVQRDEAACDVIEDHLAQIIRGWLARHPKKEVACHLASEASYVTRTCERFWQAVAQQEQALERLETALRYVRACLNSVILDTLRAHAYTPVMPFPGPTRAGEEDHEDAQASWERIRGMLPTEREQRVAYLLFHCGLPPEDIVRAVRAEYQAIDTLLLGGEDIEPLPVLPTWRLQPRKELARLNGSYAPVPLSSPVPTISELPGEMSLSALADRCMSEINNYRRGEPSNDQYSLEIFRRAMHEQDDAAWTLLVDRFKEFLLATFRRHPRSEAATRLDSPENYVARAFARFWIAAVRNQQVTFTSLGGALRYLRPQEFSNVDEIYRLRRNIVDRLQRGADQIRWRLNREV